MCKCQVCDYGRIYREKLAALPADQQPFFEALYDKMCNLSQDLDYQKCLVDGSWGGADEIIKNARERSAKLLAECSAESVAA